MEEEFLNKIGEFIVELIRDEMTIPKARFTKTGAPKSPPRYNTIGTGALYDSVSYVIRDGEIDILMNDYGVDYVFGGGSKPSTPPRSQQAIASLRKWAEAKLRIPPAKSKGVAFAIGKRLNKVGYAGIPLFTDKNEDTIRNYVSRLLEDPKYQEVIVGEIFDRINVFGTQTYNIAIGE